MANHTNTDTKLPPGILQQSRDLFLVLDDDSKIKTIFPESELSKIRDTVSGPLRNLLEHFLGQKEIKVIENTLADKKYYKTSVFPLLNENDLLYCFFEVTYSQYEGKTIPVLILRTNNNPEAAGIEKSDLFSSIELYRRCEKILKQKTTLKQRLQSLCDFIPQINPFSAEMAMSIEYNGHTFSSNSGRETSCFNEATFNTANKRVRIQTGFKERTTELIHLTNSRLFRELNQTLETLLKSYIEKAQCNHLLKESQNCYYNIFNKVGNPLYIIDSNGMFIDLNEQAVELYGYQKEEIMQLTPADLSAPKLNDHIDLDDLFKRALEGEKVSFKWWGKKKNGDIFPKEVTLRSTMVFNTKVIIANGRNISEWENAMEKLRKNESLLKAIGKNYPSGSITLINKNYLIEYIDGEELAKYNYKPEKLKGQYIFDVFNTYKQHDQYHHTKLKIDAILNGETLSYEREFNGIIYSYTGKPLPDPDDPNSNMAMIICQNITENKKNQRRLREHKDLLDSIHSNIIEGIYRSTPEGSIIYANEAFAKVFGYENSTEIRGLNVEQLYNNPESREEILNELERRKKVRNKEILLTKRDGTTFWALLNISRNTDNEGNVFYDGAVNDISEKKVLETNFNEEKNFSDTIINSLPGIFYIFDKDFNLIRWNKNVEDITGYNSQELKQITPFELTSEKVHHKIKNIADKVMHEDIIEIMEAKIINKKGYKVPFFLSITSIQRNGITYILGMGMDISEQKEIENQLKDSLDEKDILLKEIHHRVKNNLAIIQSLLYLQSQNISEPKTRAHFTESQTRIKSMALVHEKLYQSHSLARVNIKNYVMELVREIKNTFMSADQQIETEIDAEDVKISINKAVPCGLLLNELLCNAFQHAFTGLKEGKVTIKCQQTEDYIELCIIDNGHGIPKENLSDSTLGINLIQGLVNQLDGDIKFYTEDGTYVFITFKN